MPADRQQRRQRKRQLLQQGETVLKRGLPQLPSKEAVLGISLLLHEILADTRVADRASRAAETMHKVFEASLKATPPKLAIACRRGCSYCCHGWTSATAPELFLLARALRTQKQPAPEMRVEPVLARASMTAGLDIAERFGRKIPCALLVDNACGMYAARPTVCRQVTSTDLAACLDEFEGRDFDGNIVVSKTALDHARNCRLPLLAALEATRLPTHSYELGAGLRAAVTPDAEQGWLAGLEIFAGIARAPAEPAHMIQAVRTIAAELSEL